METNIDAAFVAVKQGHLKLGHWQETFFMDARVKDSHFIWLCKMVQRYSIQGPAHILHVVYQCAIKLAAMYDDLKSNENAHNLLENTAQLKHNLELTSFISSAVPERAPLF